MNIEHLLKYGPRIHVTVSKVQTYKWQVPAMKYPTDRSTSMNLTLVSLMLSRKDLHCGAFQNRWVTPPHPVIIHGTYKCDGNLTLMGESLLYCLIYNLLVWVTRMTRHRFQTVELQLGSINQTGNLCVDHRVLYPCWTVQHRHSIKTTKM